MSMHSIQKSADKFTGSICLFGLALFSGTAFGADTLTVYERSTPISQGTIASFTEGGTQTNWTMDRWISNGTLGNGRGLIGQTFTTHEQAEMASVSLKVAAFSSLASGASDMQFTLSVYEFGSAATPTPADPNNPLASFTGTMPEAFTVGNWMTFALDETVLLQADRTYGFTLEIIGREGENLTRAIINFYGSSSGGYDEGRTTSRTWSNGGGTVGGWAGLDNSSLTDLYFTVNTVIPEAKDVALAIGGASLLAVAALKRRNRK